MPQLKKSIDKKVYYKDITNEWFGDKKNLNLKVIKYVDNEIVNYKGRKYIVGSKEFKYKTFKEGEDEYAEFLQSKTDKEIIILPKAETHGVKTSDYLIDGIAYDLKNVYGKHDNQFIYHKIRGKNEQAKRFFFDIKEKSDISFNELLKQANELFKSTKDDRNWVEIIGISKKGKIVILERKNSNTSR